MLNGVPLNHLWYICVKRFLESLGIRELVRHIRQNFAVISIFCCKLRYKKLLKRAMNKPQHERIRVLFVVSEIAKWKEQSVYEEMERSGLFEPVVGLSAWNIQSRLSEKDLQKVLLEAERYFDKLGDRHVRTVDVIDGRKLYHDLVEFKPDVVYYTEPYSPCKYQDPDWVSKYALTCYTPYFVPNYGRLDWDCQLPLHRRLWAYFCLNEKWQAVFENSLRYVFRSVKFVPLGHPSLDYLVNSDRIKGQDYIIYAPHHSFPHVKRASNDQNYGTFEWNGVQILEYAKAHREFSWVFKPHPLLRGRLQETGLMSKREIDRYYKEWENIGKVCLGGDYQDLFLESRAMITDCGSFLTEYGATGKPIIHLISKSNTMSPIWLTKKLYDTYYRVDDLDSMYEVFMLVLEDLKDPNFNARLAAVKETCSCGVNAAENISRFLLRTFGRK